MKTSQKMLVVYGAITTLWKPKRLKTPEHESYKEWNGSNFDPDGCDIDEINEVLTEYCR